MMTSKIAITAVLMSFAMPAAQAQIVDPVDGILSCRDIASIEARLACFDTAADALATAREAGDIVTVTRQDVEAVERDSFGFRLPSLPRFRLPIFAGRVATENPARSRGHDAMDGVDTARTNDTTNTAPLVVADAGDASPAPSTSAPATQAPATPAPATPVTATPVSPTSTPPATTTPVSPTPAQPATATPDPTATAEAPASPNEDVQIVERDRDGDVFMVEMAIRSTRSVGYNTTIFYMENGQVWRQTDTTTVNVPNRDVGNVAQIRLAAMESYLLRINGRGRAIRVRRER